MPAEYPLSHGHPLDLPMAMDSPPKTAPHEATTAQLGIGSRSFIGLVATQFLGATNDNIFRWLAVGVGKDYFPNQEGTILAAGLACFVLPYLVFAAPAGYLADRFSKRTVIVVCKAAEIVLMAAGMLAIWMGSVHALFCVVFLMGAQSALFGPSKLGSIPEMLRPRHISAANGVMGLVTVGATMVGFAIGNVLSDDTDWLHAAGQSHFAMAALVLVGVAAVGLFTSIFICRLEPARPNLPFSFRLVRQTMRDLQALAANRPLLRVSLGITFFWFLGSLAQVNIDQYAFEGGLSEQKQLVPLAIAMVAGMGLGSVLAGVWSQGKVELGILPLGVLGIMLSTGLLFLVTPQLEITYSHVNAAYVAACICLFLLGASAGLFQVPLEAFMQHRSEPENRGQMLAACNFLTFAGMLVASGLFHLVRLPGPSGQPVLSARQIFLLCGVAAIPVLVYVVWLLPQATIRFCVWLASHTVYRVKVFGREHLPERGGAILVPNHITWVDAVFLLMASSRPVRLVAEAQFIQSGWVSWLAKTMGVIPIQPGQGRKGILQALQSAKDAANAGELVCIFPEGGLTRSGQLQEFKPGVMRIIEGSTAPVIPVYLDGLWGSIFSFSEGRFFWKWPKRWPYPVAVHFGPAIHQAQSPHQLRSAVLDLGAEAVATRVENQMTLPRLFLRQARRRLRQIKVSDSTQLQLTGGKLLTGTLVLRRVLRRLLAKDDTFVGVLLPPSVGALLANAALTLDRRVAVNLNYTVSEDVMRSCIEQAGIRKVITSRKVMAKLGMHITAELIYIEDLKGQATRLDKALCAAAAYAMPISLLERWLGLTSIKHSDLMTLIFTSGSTGEPKGVMLTFGNIGSNVAAMEQVLQFRDDDVVLGILPFFHSFGYTITMWGVLGLKISGIYHYSPLEAKEIGALVEKHRCNILMATPTFLRGYLRRCTPEQFRSLELVVCGAEKLPQDLVQAFDERFHIRPVEGYGTTELSPLVSVNIPPSRAFSKNADGINQPTLKEGTVGRPVPGVSAKAVDPDTYADLPMGASGMLLVKGPNVMAGYYGKPDQTAKVIRDGWYITGDMARIDTQGFIEITGRLSRFSKIGGEMVPHLRIEEELERIVGTGEKLQVAVAAVPDARKGERIVVLHTHLDKTPEEMVRALAEAGLPNLFLPSPDSFAEVEAIPVLGTGKLDLRHLKELAQEKFGGVGAAGG